MDLQTILKKIDVKADCLGIYEFREIGTTFSVVDQKPRSNSVDVDHGYRVEVLLGGQIAYACTNDISFQGIERAAKQASLWAQQMQKFKLTDFTVQERPKALGEYSSFVEKKFDRYQVAGIYDLLLQSNTKAKIDSEIVNVSSYMMLIDTQTRYVNTNGAAIQQSFNYLVNYLGVTAQDGQVTQTRSNGTETLQTGIENLNGELLNQQATKIGLEAKSLLKAEQCPTGKYDVILMPDQMYLQIHESIGHPLELDRILGDERNYAGWSFVKPEDFGTLQYGSKLLNVTFDPENIYEFASYGFDEVGNPATKEFLIKEGVLLRGLGSLESQKRLKVKGVANSRSSSWNRPPIDRMANINIEPGSTSLNEMIASTERGILMRTNKSWSIDDYRNKFQFGCEFAELIENGKITKVLKNPNYRGISVPFWNSLKMIGDPSTVGVLGSPYCGKGEPNQIIRVGHASPACLFEQLDVFGGV